MPLRYRNAISLTELLVATIAVSIVMLAVMSIDRALQQSHQGTSRNALISMKSSAIMLAITKNVQMATGDKNDMGIEIDTSTDTFCVRREDPDLAPVDQTPGDYSDDIWICYTLDGNNINYCQTAPGGAPAECTTGSSDFQHVIGTVINNPPDALGTKGFVATMTDDPVTGEFYVEMTLINRDVPTAEKDPFKNPEITLTSKVTPASMGSSIE